MFQELICALWMMPQLGQASRTCVQTLLDGPVLNCPADGCSACFLSRFDKSLLCNGAEKELSSLSANLLGRIGSIKPCDLAEGRELVMLYGSMDGLRGCWGLCSQVTIVFETCT